MFLVGFTAQTIRIEGLGFLHVGYKEQVKVLRLDLDNIKAAQIAAKAIAEAERLRIEAEYREQAEKIDEQYKDRLASANARADAYARRMRAKASDSLSGAVGTSAEDNTAESVDGSSETAFILVSRPDFDILNENTIRLEQAHEWALGLNQVGEE